MQETSPISRLFIRALLAAAMLAPVAAARAQGTPPSARPAAPTLIPPMAQNPSFNLVNRSPTAIRELFVTPAGNANWGQNRLDGKAGNPTSIAPGASFAVRRRIDTNCIFDIRVVYVDGKTEDRRGLNTCALEDVTIGATAPAGTNAATGKPADDPSVKLFNRAARPVTEVYMTPAGLTNWGQNRLGQDRLLPDGTRLFTLPRDGSCIFDLRVVFADGKALEKKRANLCRIGELPVP